MACGAPVVAFANSSIPEVTGNAAALVPDGDIPAMAQVVSDLLASTDKAKAIAAAGVLRAREFSWRQHAKATWSIYSEMSG